MLTAIPLVYAQQPPLVYAQQPSLDTCYTDLSTGFYMSSLFTPSKKIDTTDPQVKSFMTSLCTFYHEKTGVWLSSSMSDSEIDHNVFLQYYEQYKDSFK